MHLDEIIQYFVRFVALVMAMPVHEYAHARVAKRLGDNTAEEKGRLTLNPASHIDPIGAIMLLVAGFGWARPVPVDMRNFKHPRRDMALTALAGPVSNLLIALIIMVCSKLLDGFMPHFRYNQALNSLLILFRYMISINILLAVFNFLPMPPLDGSKIIGGILPKKAYLFMLRYERVFSVVIVILLFTPLLDKPIGWMIDHVAIALDFITKPIEWLFRR